MATGARVLHLHNADRENLYSISFRTPPPDHTGVPHILEHAVLCGSEKYPVKEPFVELMKGSLQTFLNAFTYPDKTCYPVASANVQDFYNLVGVVSDIMKDAYPELLTSVSFIASLAVSCGCSCVAAHVLIRSCSTRFAASSAATGAARPSAATARLARRATLRRYRNIE